MKTFANILHNKFSLTPALLVALSLHFRGIVLTTTKGNNIFNGSLFTSLCLRNPLWDVWLSEPHSYILVFVSAVCNKTKMEINLFFFTLSACPHFHNFTLLLIKLSSLHKVVHFPHVAISVNERENAIRRRKAKIENLLCFIRRPCGT